MIRRGVAILVLVAAGASVTACGSASTPLCEAAAPLLAHGQVAAAAELYARAAQAGEGDCASSGLTSTGEAYTKAYDEAAAGAQAEERGDTAGATGHYQASLAADAANPAAVEGLTRLGRSAIRRQTPVTVVPAPVTSTGPSVLVLVLLGVLTLLVGAAALLAFRRLRAHQTALEGLQEHDRRTGSDLGELRADLGTRLDDHDTSLERVDESTRGLADAMTEMSAGSSRHDEQLTALRSDVAVLRRDADALRDAVMTATTGELRLVACAVEGPAPPRGGSCASTMLLWWPECTRETGVVDLGADRVPADVLTVLVGRNDPAPAPRRLLHEYRVEAPRLDAGLVFAREPVARSAAVLGGDPDVDAAVDVFRDALGAAVLDPRGWRAIPLPDGEPRHSPAERTFWRLLDGVVILELSRRIAADRRRTDVCAYVTSQATSSLLVDEPGLVPSLLGLVRDEDIDTAASRVEDALRGALERYLVHRLIGRPHSRIPSTRAGTAVRIADGVEPRMVDLDEEWPDVGSGG